MRKFILAVSAFALAGTAAFADPIADRKAIMKERGGIIAGLSKVVKGEEKFDAAAVDTALKALQANAEKFDVDALYPAGSETGGETKASPKIWEDTAGFKAAAEKYLTEVKAAAAAAPADLEAFKTQFSTVVSNCGTCHQAYRL